MIGLVLVVVGCGFEVVMVFCFSFFFSSGGFGGDCDLFWIVIWGCGFEVLMVIVFYFFLIHRERERERERERGDERREKRASNQ